MAWVDDEGKIHRTQNAPSPSNRSDEASGVFLENDNRTYGDTRTDSRRTHWKFVLCIGSLIVFAWIISNGWFNSTPSTAVPAVSTPVSSASPASASSTHSSSSQASPNHTSSAFESSAPASSVSEQAQTSSPQSTSTSSNSPQQVIVPNVINMKESEAVRKLSDIGLSAKVEYKDTTSDSQIGTVDSCSAIGRSLNTGDEVTIIVWRDSAIIVPNVVDMKEREAKNKLEALGLRVWVDVMNVESQKYDGDVIECSNVGQRMKRGDYVTITVAVYPYVEVPDIYNLTEQQANEVLSKVGLSASVNREAVYDKSDDGVVIQCDASGSLVNKGSYIRMTIGVYSIVTVPQIRGMKESDAISALRSLGLSVIVEREDVNEKSKDTIVLECDYEGGEVEKGESVTIIVGRYIEFVTVPDVLGLNEKLARSRLTNAGFKVSVWYENVDDSDYNDRVISCDDAGYEIEKGTTIIITVGRYRE